VKSRANRVEHLKNAMFLARYLFKAAERMVREVADDGIVTSSCSLLDTEGLRGAIGAAKRGIKHIDNSESKITRKLQAMLVSQAERRKKRRQNENDEPLYCHNFKGYPDFPGCCEDCHEHDEEGLCGLYEGILPDGRETLLCCKVHDWFYDDSGKAKWNEGAGIAKADG